MGLITSTQDEVADGVTSSWVTPACCPLTTGTHEVSVLPLTHMCVTGLRLASLVQTGYWVWCSSF